jgi:hypothetical protein
MSAPRTPITGQRFSMLAMQIARRATEWSHEQLVMDELADRMPVEARQRFKNEIRDILERIHDKP